MKTISWISKEVLVANIAATPKNYKIKTALGKQRLQASLKSFGLAGNVVCNYAGKFGDITKLVLIDGNSRREEAIEMGIKKLWVSLPSQKLTPKEFNEMSALFDFAKAGEVDMERIKKDLGTTAGFFDKYAIEVPMDRMKTMGAKAEAGEKLTAKKSSAPSPVDEVPIYLYYTQKQHDDFREIETRLAKKFRTTNTSETILKVLRSVK